MWHNKTTNQIQSEKPYPGWLHPDIVAVQYPDWEEVTDDFIPTTTLTTQQRVDALNNEYLQRFSALKDAILAADALDDADTVASLKEAYAALRSEYNTKMEEITG